MEKAKPFEISKREVWESFKLVKAKKGSAGVDEQTIAEFEKDLANNLYKLWNRMSSGSYFPLPVKRVAVSYTHLDVYKRQTENRQVQT